MRQFNLKFEAAAKNRALDLIEEHRGDLVSAAKALAVELANKRGRVTSPEVLEEMRERGMSEALQGKDPRFMGAVFRKGWVQVGTEKRGSHCRPVSVWRIA